MTRNEILEVGVLHIVDTIGNVVPQIHLALTMIQVARQLVLRLYTIRAQNSLLRITVAFRRLSCSTRRYLKHCPIISARLQCLTLFATQ